MKGQVWKRCPCRLEELPRGRDGRPLACKPRHGTWSYRLEAGLDPVTGKRRRPSKGGYATRMEAEAALSDEMTAVGAGTWTDDQRQTVGQFLDRWLARKTSGLKPTTVDTYRSHIELHIRPELGQLKLRDLRPEHIYAMLQVVA